MIIGIACVDLNYGIGQNNRLLFHIQEDMKFFKETTTGHVVVMGRKTLESFPNGMPLKNRLNIVLTSKDSIENCFCIHSMEELLKAISSIQEDVYIIGGASIYNQFYQYFDKIYLTKVYTHAKADAYFPHQNINSLFTKTYCSKIFNDNNYKFQFLTYERKTD